MKLHIDSLPPALDGLLKGLMKDAVLRDFHLVGGTAPALQFGHRVSVDIDLFSVPASFCFSCSARTKAITY